MPDSPIILISPQPDWLDSLSGVLPEGYSLRRYHDRSGYVARLTDDHAALILVDGASADWRFWTTTPKTSPATRRIPIFLIADEADDRAAALLAGADLALSPTDLTQDFARLVRDYARVFDPQHAEALECECQKALPDLAEQGFQKFNASEFYEQHDLFEALWVQTETPVRDLYRAILQVGVAYYQILRGNHRGARKMLLRSVQWLTILPDECQGIDVRQLREDSYRVRAALETLREDEIDQFDRSLLRPVRKVGE
ncbi:MAG: DUF309 domain-containing protein [bacterium]|nr:DUF309 domain-containing protein [bacterium]